MVPSSVFSVLVMIQLPHLANGKSITCWRDHPVQVLLFRLGSHRRPEIGLPRHLRAAYADHGEQKQMARTAATTAKLQSVPR